MSARSIASGGALLAALAPLAFAQDSGDPAAGERLAAGTCAECHGSGSANGRAPRFVAIAAMPSTTAASLAAFLSTTHASMPNLTLSAADRSDLIAYILSLRP